MSDAAAPSVDEAIPMVCLVADVCRVLRISRAHYFHLRKLGTFPIPEIEPRIGDPRFYGADVRRYLAGDFAAGTWRRRKGSR